MMRNWYGYPALQRLDIMNRNAMCCGQSFPQILQLGRAVANLQTVTVAEETAGANEDERESQSGSAFEHRA